jgi:hypothetical protein
MTPDRSSSMSGMHITPEQLDRLRDGTLPPAEVAEAGGHAATCEACGRAVAAARSLRRMTRDLRVQLEAGHETEHLSEEELMACADGTVRDDVHLQECERCRVEVEELVRFRSSMRPPVRRRWMPYAVAATIAAVAVTIPLLDRAPDAPATPPRIATSPVPESRPAPSPVPVATGYGRPEWDEWVADVKERRALPVPAIIAELRASKTRLRGGAEADDLRLSPDHAVVADPRPRFQWSGRQGASYNVILRDGDAIVESGALTEPQWKPRQNLKRGREYLWQVETTSGSTRAIYPKAPDPPARFRVLAQHALDEIDEVRKQYPDNPLLHAVILARHGLRAETLAALDRLRRTDEALAADLRESLRRWPA